MEKTIREKYYYCGGCKKFHPYESHTEVNRKLCFFCETIKPTTKKIGNSEIGYTQVCSDCRKEYFKEQM